MVFNVIMNRFETSATGVVDLGRGQTAIAPEMRYKQHNAGVFIKVPVAADFGCSLSYMPTYRSYRSSLRIHSMMDAM